MVVVYLLMLREEKKTNDVVCKSKSTTRKSERTIARGRVLQVGSMVNGELQERRRLLPYAEVQLRAVQRAHAPSRSTGVLLQVMELSGCSTMAAATITEPI